MPTKNDFFDAALQVADELTAYRRDVEKPSAVRSRPVPFGMERVTPAQLRERLAAPGLKAEREALVKSGQWKTLGGKKKG